MMPTRAYGILATLIISSFIFSSPVSFASMNFPEDDANDPYHVGKIIYHRKLACPNCPMSKTIIDPSMYKSVIERLNTDKELMTALNEKERTAVVYYLETLFTPR
ncbi:MAG: hypothetical protein ACI85N_001371 [Gammaproteobacteria bacterium]|jgi:hypothetical protein